MAFLYYYAKYAPEALLIQHYKYYINDPLLNNHLIKIAMKRSFTDLYKLLTSISSPAVLQTTNNTNIKYSFVKYPLYLDLLVNEKIRPESIWNLLDIAIQSNNRPVIEHLMNNTTPCVTQIKNPDSILCIIAAIGDIELFDLVYSVEQPKSIQTEIIYELVNPELLERIENQLKNPLEIHKYYLTINKPINNPNISLIIHMFNQDYPATMIVDLARKLPNDSFGALSEDHLRQLYDAGLEITPDILFELVRGTSYKRYRFINDVYLKPEHMFLCYYDTEDFLRFVNPALANLRDYRGYNLFSRLKRDNPRAVRAMCNMGVNINNVNNSKITPLMGFIKQNQYTSARILVKYNADVNAVNSQKKTALSYAKSLECIAVLLDGGIKDKNVTKKLKTALSIKNESDILYSLANYVSYRSVFRSCLRYGLPNQRTPTTFANDSIRRLYESITLEFNPKYYCEYSRNKQQVILTLMEINTLTNIYIPIELLYLIFSNL